MVPASAMARLSVAPLIALTLLPGPAAAEPDIKATTQWIVDKLIANGKRQKVGAGSNETYYAQTTRAAADHCRLIVQTRFEMKIDTFVTKFTLPMTDFKNTQRKPFSDKTRDIRMLYVFSDRKTIAWDQTDSSGRSQNWQDELFVPFDVAREPEIFARMEAALKHFARLAKANPKCRSKEAF